MADADDVEAAAALYAAAQLEQLGVLRVCDRLVELYLRGGLPVGGPSAVAALLDSYWLGRAERLPEDARRELYARVVGPGFEHLLERLATAIAGPDRAGEPASVAWAADELRAGEPDSVAWAADELRSNIRAHVGDDELAATAQLRAQLGDALAILSAGDLLNAYGARDPWQLVDQLARLELGVEPDIPRHHALAAAGTLVVAYVAAEDRSVSEEVADAARSWLAALPRVDEA